MRKALPPAPVVRPIRPDTELNDPQPRPSSEHQVLINAIGPVDGRLLATLARRINDSGCTMLESRCAALGGEFVISALAGGSWDALAKLEGALTRLQRDEDIVLHWKRTSGRQPSSKLLPYMVEVVAADRPGILHRLAEFFARRDIQIEHLASSRYAASLTGAEMFSANLTIGIPADTHIASLRDEFLEFCDTMNLDAILDPVKS